MALCLGERAFGFDRFLCFAIHGMKSRSFISCPINAAIILPIFVSIRHNGSLVPIGSIMSFAHHSSNCWCDIFDSISSTSAVLATCSASRSAVNLRGLRLSFLRACRCPAQRTQISPRLRLQVAQLHLRDVSQVARSDLL